MVAGAGAFLRGCTGILWNQHIEAMLVVAAPPPNGRRSNIDGEAERRRSQTTGAGTIKGVIERARMLWRFSGSPGSR
jgi:hypothetical protein